MAIQLKRSLSSDINQNYILADGQVGIEKRTSKNVNNTMLNNSYLMKIGDGVSKWSALPYVVPPQLGWLNGAIEWVNAPRTDYNANTNLIMQIGAGAWYLSPTTLRLRTTHVVNGTASRSADVELDCRLSSYGALVANGTNFSGSQSSGEVSLGAYGQNWSAVYATTGTIQTSDRAAKTNIHRLADGQIATIDLNGEDTTTIDLSDIINFVNKLDPCTFDYIVNGLHPENRQLGLIADDIESDKLFPYIGCRLAYEADESRNKPAGSTLALKPLPLAVAALTTCKYLLSRLDVIEDALSKLS